MKKLLITVALVALAAPSAFAAPTDTSTSPAKLCKAQRASMSAADFASLYAPAKPKSALGRCIAQQGKLVATSAANAAKQCSAERALTDDAFKASHDGKTFAEHYGRNANDRNAYGKCISAKAKEKIQAQQSSVLNAARACRAERVAKGAETFRSDHGTNKTKSNAFGKCVASKAKSGS